MKKVELKIGIIDDDPAKVTQIIMRLMEGITGATSEKKYKYSKYEFKPHEISLKKNIKDMVSEIVDLELDCILIDYNLSSYEAVNYNGIEIAKEISERLYEYPVFVLTSYEDDLFNKEVFNAYQVFNFERYLGEDSERIELNFKIIEQILKKNKQIEQWEREIRELLPLAGTSIEIDKQLLELDEYLERSINGLHSFPKKIKKDFSANKIDELLTKIDKILEKE